MISTVVRVPPALDDAVAELLPGILEQLSTTLPIRGPPDRIRPIDIAAAELRVAVVHRFAREQLGLDAVSVPADSPVWDLLMGHHEVSDPDTTVLLSHYVRAGGGDLGIEAFSRVWRAMLEAATGERVHPLRDRPLPDYRYRVRAPADVEPSREVLIGVSRDPLEVLRLGHPRLGGSCLDCVDGTVRHAAQTYLLHPDIAVLYAWSRRPDGGRGERLARLAAIATEHGLFPLSDQAVTSSRLGFDPAFVDYLRRWAAFLGTSVVVGEDQPGLLPAGFAGRPEDVMIIFPAAGFGPVDTWFDAVGGGLRLPHIEVLPLYTLSPPAG